MVSPIDIERIFAEKEHKAGNETDEKQAQRENLPPFLMTFMEPSAKHDANRVKHRKLNGLLTSLY
jgi:hypothetical protein